MLARLLLLFVVVPLIELAILVRLGGLLGFWPTMAIVITTGVLGALLARDQGTRVLRDIRSDLAAGHPPAGHLVDGLLILVGGALLLTPGILTDFVGLLLLFPLSRRRLKDLVRLRFEGMVRSGDVKLITLIR